MEPHNVLTSPLFLRGREDFLEQVQKASSQNEEPCLCTYTSKSTFAEKEEGGAAELL